MITKKIQIDFANPGIRAIDEIKDIRKAVEYASLNLYSRHNVRLQTPMPSDDDKVIMEIWIPDDIAEGFSVGNHLRGIAVYLLKCCDGKYKKYLMGKRLLVYSEASSTNCIIRTISVAERLETMVDLARLLERSDPEAIDQINRIQAILSEPQS